MPCLVSCGEPPEELGAEMFPRNEGGEAGSQTLSRDSGDALG